MAKVEKVNLLQRTELPEDYHCDCEFCQDYKGILIQPDGSYYSKLEWKNHYIKNRHIAKTPLHIARWAVQQFSKPGDWVLDPTIGSGTSGVEALLQNRNAAGVEIEFGDVAMANLKNNVSEGLEYHLIKGDARDIGTMFDRKFQLVINNPPYSGDQRQKAWKKSDLAAYDSRFKNLAFMKESPEYWKVITDIYSECYKLTEKEGYFVLGVKDMVKNKAPYILHFYYGIALEEAGYTYVGMVLLPHWPPTMFMNTYNKRFPDVKVPRYQTILIFRKKGD